MTFITFKEEKHNEAIEIYTEILQLSDLSSENQAVIYSNRSATYLMLKSKDSLELAKDDAEKAIKCWPSWWKGYYRLARVHVVQENWNEAEQILHHAFAMNSESKFVRDEISYVRKKTGMLSRQSRAIPKEKFKEATGMSEEEFRNVEKRVHSLPGIDDVMKGHQYRSGIEVQQDYKKAAQFYEKAANLGSPIGMYHLGLLYQDGNGVKRDFEESMKWLLKAANTKPTSLTASSRA
uniref:Uncharacterized protein n=1 Tax=Panagrolaimus davidi TaxID=227884 RepID=A0A914QCM0_9BILA